MINQGEHLEEFLCEGVRKVVFNNKLNCYVDASSEQIKDKKFIYQFKFSIVHLRFGKATCIVNVTTNIIEEKLENKFLLYNLRKQYSDLVKDKING